MQREECVIIAADAVSRGRTEPMTLYGGSSTVSGQLEDLPLPQNRSLEEFAIAEENDDVVVDEQ